MLRHPSEGPQKREESSQLKASISEIRRLHKSLVGAKSHRDVFLLNGQFKTILAGSSRAELFIQDPQMVDKWAGTYAAKIKDKNGEESTLPIEYLLEDFCERSTNVTRLES